MQDLTNDKRDAMVIFKRAKANICLENIKRVLDVEDIGSLEYITTVIRNNLQEAEKLSNEISLLQRL